MEKLRLSVDTLRVESFPTSEGGEEAGTVLAAEMATLRTAQCGTCAGATCGGATCYTSCGGGYPGCTCPIPL